MSDDQQQRPPGAPKLTLTPELALGQYSNFVTVAHNFAEVVLDFGRALPGRQDIPVVSRIIMNPFQAKQLLRALSHNLDIYERTYGPIAGPPAQGTDTLPPEGTN